MDTMCLIPGDVEQLPVRGNVNYTKIQTVARICQLEYPLFLLASLSSSNLVVVQSWEDVKLVGRTRDESSKRENVG